MKTYTNILNKYVICCKDKEEVIYYLNYLVKNIYLFLKLSRLFVNKQAGRYAALLCTRSGDSFIKACQVFDIHQFPSVVNKW